MKQKRKWYDFVRPITDRRKFYLLSFTWGLPMNLAGAFVALVMLLTGHKPRRHGPCVYFQAGKNWGGMDWGMFIVVCKNHSEAMLDHEMGHAMQNCHFGFLMPFIVGLPSSSRYWFRRVREDKLKKASKTAYDSAWFEGQATRLGFEYRMLTNENTARL